MLPKTFHSIKFIVQTLSVILSFLINFLLINLIITKSSKKMGTYRYLMVYFCCSSIFFSFMDIVVQPVHGVNMLHINFEYSVISEYSHLQIWFFMIPISGSENYARRLLR
ncbi:hypothetical protein CRE_09954, partial [Caenorhabditis remanei]